MSQEASWPASSISGAWVAPSVETVPTASTLAVSEASCLSSSTCWKAEMAPRALFGSFSGADLFVYVCRIYDMLDPQHLEQMVPPGRTRCEYYHRSRITVTGPSFTSSTSINAPKDPV